MMRTFGKPLSAARALFAEVRWSFAVALGVLGTVALCGASTDKKPPPEARAALWVTLALFGLCAVVALVQMGLGKREAVTNWLSDRNKRQTDLARLQEMALQFKLSCRALSLALARDFQQADGLLASFPGGEPRDLVAFVVDLLRRRADAVELLHAWEGRAQCVTDSNSALAVERREALLLAMSELAAALRLQVPPDLCRHPKRDAECCDTCGTDFRAGGAEVVLP